MYKRRKDADPDHMFALSVDTVLEAVLKQVGGWGAPPLSVKRFQD
jgi:hypothetical protein